MKFCVTAENDQGLTFQVTFHNPNWNGATAAAQRAVNKAVKADPFHKKHGPFLAKNIDVTA
jgi:hypothetical protein